MIEKLNQYLLKRIPTKPSVTLSHRKVYILPTKEGYYFALILLLMLLTAINFSNNLIYIFTFFLASLVIVTMVYTQFNLLGITIQCGKAEPVFSGDLVYLPLVISSTNPKTGLNQCVSIELEHTVQHIDITANKTTKLIFPVASKQRGYLVIPKIIISSKYPLSLFRTWSIIKLSSTNIVYPHPLKTEQINQTQFSNGQNISGNKSGYDEFHSLTNYFPGLSLKKVHWKMVAKGQGMYVKQFVEGSNQQEYWLDINTFTATSNQEQRLSYLSYLIQQANKQNDRYGLRLSKHSIPINTGLYHYHQCLTALALHHPTATIDAETAQHVNLINS